MKISENANIERIVHPATGDVEGQCRGCGYRSSVRGVHVHQSARYVTLACRPIAATNASL